MSEPSDQLPPFNSELVVIFLKFLYDQDPVKQLLEVSEVDQSIEVDWETMQRVNELVKFGGFSDTRYLQRTLAKEFEQMEQSFKEAFLMPFTTISKKIHCKNILPLFPVSSSAASSLLQMPTSISYYKDICTAGSSCQTLQQRLMDYICFRIPDESFSNMHNCIGIARGFMHGSTDSGKSCTSLEAVLLCVPDEYECVDLSLYKESQIVLLLNERISTSDSPENARMMIVQACDLPFLSVSRPSNSHKWALHELKDYVVNLLMENGKIRYIPHLVTVPLAVSASRGVACVFAARKRALVYILEENEDEVSDVE